MDSAEVRKYYNRFWFALLVGCTVHTYGSLMRSDDAMVFGVVLLAISFPMFLKARAVHRVYKDELIREQARMAARRAV